VGSCRRDLLDQIIALNERHLKRLLSEYVRYHHEDRTHLGLEKGTPDGRIRSVALGPVHSEARLGGLHHRYSSGIVRINFRTVLYICALHAHAGSPSPRALYRVDSRLG
jgi:hypothetical protein